MSPTASRARSAAAVRSAPARGKLEWRALLGWLREDGWITNEDAERVVKRFGGADSSQHPLVRLGAAGLKRLGQGGEIDTEVLTQWLAQRFNLQYLRIDPLKVDVGRVADVMSVHYAEVRHVLPVTVGNAEVVVATSEPFDTTWIAEIEGYTRKSVRIVVANPLEIARYTTEFFTLAKSVRAAQKSGEGGSASANFEQLVELGKTNKQLDANDAAGAEAANLCIEPSAPPARGGRAQVEPHKRVHPLLGLLANDPTLLQVEGGLQDVPPGTECKIRGLPKAAKAIEGEQALVGVDVCGRCLDRRTERHPCRADTERHPPVRHGGRQQPRVAALRQARLRTCRRRPDQIPERLDIPPRRVLVPEPVANCRNARGTESKPLRRIRQRGHERIPPAVLLHHDPRAAPGREGGCRPLGVGVAGEVCWSWIWCCRNSWRNASIR